MTEEHHAASPAPEVAAVHTRRKRKRSKHDGCANVPPATYDDPASALLESPAMPLRADSTPRTDASPPRDAPEPQRERAREPDVGSGGPPRTQTAADSTGAQSADPPRANTARHRGLLGPLVQEMRARAAAGDAGEPDGPTNDAEIHSEVCTVTIRAQAGREAGGNGGGGKREVGRFKHGNYHNYYGKRLEKRSPLDDPRLAVFDPAWFKGRTMLDVGCHEGVVILSVAQRFGISGALGIDIDPVLVRRAVRRLMAARNAAREERRGHAPTHGAEATLLPPAERLDALKHVRFRAGDVLSLEGEVPRGTFGVVTCLSVTKWVHIHGGDDGLRRLLRLLAGAAEPGGHVIVEPQPWKSYRQAASHRDTKQEWMPGRLAELQLRPEDIPRLLSEEGLVEVGVLRPEGSKEGFGRPLHVLRKPGAPGAGDA